jgi:glycosyltransferase involved in cell wall biosynthesis
VPSSWRAAFLPRIEHLVSAMIEVLGVRISFIIPAHNEEEHLSATLEALRGSTDQASVDWSEIIVVDDDSTDSTADIALSHSVQVISVVKKQISAARNAGAHVAVGDVFIFIDADTIVTAGAIKQAAAAMEQGRTFGGASIRFDEPCPRWATVVLPLFLLVYRAAKLAPGCFFVVRRDLFEKVGGFDESIFAGEETLLARSLKKAGGQYYLGGAKVITSGRKLRDHSGWVLLRTLVRIVLKGKRGVQSRDGLDLWYGD